MGGAGDFSAEAAEAATLMDSLPIEVRTAMLELLRAMGRRRRGEPSR